MFIFDIIVVAIAAQAVIGGTLEASTIIVSISIFPFPGQCLSAVDCMPMRKARILLAPGEVPSCH